jgi:hypothetical protein
MKKPAPGAKNNKQLHINLAGIISKYATHGEELSGNAKSIGAGESLDNSDALLLEGLGVLSQDNLGSVLEELLKTLDRQVLLVDLASEKVREDLLLGLKL